MSYVVNSLGNPIFTNLGGQLFAILPRKMFLKLKLNGFDFRKFGNACFVLNPSFIIIRA